MYTYLYNHIFVFFNILNNSVIFFTILNHFINEYLQNKSSRGESHLGPLGSCLEGRGAGGKGGDGSEGGGGDKGDKCCRKEGKKSYA